MTKCQKDPPCGIFLKRGLFKDVKNDIPMCQKRKYKKYTNTQIQKHTNTQIQHMTNCQKNPPCGIHLKRGLFKDVKNEQWPVHARCMCACTLTNIYIYFFSIDIVCTEIE